MARRRRIVEVHRAIADVGSLEGVVVGVGRRWVLVAELDDVRVHGFVAVRRHDVTRVRAAGGQAFQRRYLEMTEAWPLPSPAVDVDLDSTRGLVTSLAAAYPLLTVCVEYDDPDVCFIGAVAKAGKKWLQIDEVTTTARWRGRSRYRYEHISRIDVGGHYETALYAVAGPCPTS